MANEQFEYNGRLFEVLSHSPARDDLFTGMWLRFQYGPYEGPDLVAKILNVQTWWPRAPDGYGAPEVRIDLSRSGSGSADCYQTLSDGFIEIVRPIDD